MNMSEELLYVEEDTLLIDIGSGTQDALYAHAKSNPENWSRFVLPSPAKLVAQKIKEVTQQGKHLMLYGQNMGGGFFYAVQEHLSKGLKVKITEDAAYSINDTLEKVKALGLEIVSEEAMNSLDENEYAKIKLADFSQEFWQYFLEPIHLDVPKRILIAAQDHGKHENSSNCVGRFNLWRELLATSNNPVNWIFDSVPRPFTRLEAIRKSSNACSMADTGTAALLGVLSMSMVRKRSEREGVTIVNIGNSHVIAFLVYQAKVYGIYEHHTGLRTTESLLKDLQEFKLGWLPDENVRDSGGHGCVFSEIPHDAEGFKPTYILGPQRKMLQGHGLFVAPNDDMMLAGAYGLLYGLNERSCDFVKATFQM